MLMSLELTRMRACPVLLGSLLKVDDSRTVFMYVPTCVLYFDNCTSEQFDFYPLLDDLKQVSRFELQIC